MNPNKSRPGLALVALLLLFAGCVGQRIVWSPDGRLAAILGDTGLFLADADGKVTGPLASDVTHVAWFPDSRRVAVVREHKCTNWTQIEAHVPPGERKRLTDAARVLKAEMDAGRDLWTALGATPIAGSNERALFGIYLRQFESRVASNTDETNARHFGSLEASTSDLSVASVADGKWSGELRLAKFVGGVLDLRVSPDGTSIVYSMQSVEGPNRHDCALRLAASDGSKPEIVVAEHAAAYADWTPDGRSLVYIAPTGASDVDGTQLRLGAVTRSRVIGDKGELRVQGKPEELAGLIFDESGRVRCLKDGRILFAALDVHLPATTAEMPERQKLYALDPSRQSTLTPLIPQGAQGDLPESAAVFEPSPDGKSVAIFGRDNWVAVLELATGKVDTLQPATKADGVAGSEPAWRNAEELSYVSIPKDGGKSQVNLWIRGKSRSFSDAWPAELRKGLLEK